MHASHWVLGLAAASLGAAAAAAGCSSSSSGGPGPVDAGSPSDAACYVDASLSVFASSDAAGAPCAECVAEMCYGAVQMCAIDCACINFFTCVADSGVAVNGFTPMAIQAATICAGSQAAVLENDPAVRGLSTCLGNTCSGVCMPGAEGGPSEEPGDASPDADAGAAPDGDAASPHDGAIGD